MITSKDRLRFLLYWTAIFIVSGSMLVYGIAKPIQFQNLTPADHSSLSEGHQLMWKFYSYTKAYPIIIGVFEVIGAVSMLFNRARVFGCFLLTIILGNIIVQDYLYDISALNSAIFSQFLVLVILIFDFEKVKIIMRNLFTLEIRKINKLLLRLALLMALFIKFFETIII